MDQTNFADQFVNGLLAWVRWIGEKIVGMFQTQSAGGTSGGNTLFSWFSNNWIGLLIVLVATGILLDWIVWMVRWRPYWLWFGKKRVLYDDDIDLDLTDEELARRFGPMEPRIEGREHFRASQLGRAGRPMYGDDEDIEYMMGREPARPVAQNDDYDDYDDYDDGPDVEDPYGGRAENAYRRQADSRRARDQRHRFEVEDEDDAFDDLYDDEDFDDEPYDEYDDEYDEYDDSDDRELYDDAAYDEYDDEYADDEEADDQPEEVQPAASRIRRGLKLNRLTGRKAKTPPAVEAAPKAEAKAKRERPARNTAFVSASRGGHRTGSDLIHSAKPTRHEHVEPQVDPSDDPFSVDDLIDDEDDGFMEVVSSMAQSPLPPVGRLPKNMPDPSRDIEIASELVPDSDKLPGDWRTGYSGVYEAVQPPDVGELETAFSELEASSRRARRRARDQKDGSQEAANIEPIEGTFEDE